MAGKTPMEQIGVDLPEKEPVEAAEVEQVQAAEERPDWLPEKFKDPSALAEGYKSLEAELTRRADDQRRLEAQVESLTEAFENLNSRPSPQQQQQPNDQIREQLMAAYEADPIGTIAMLAQQYSQQTVDQRIQQLQQQNTPHFQAQQEQQNQLLAITVDNMMTQRHDDWAEMKEIVAKEIENDPYLLPEQVIQAGPEATARALERVYASVKAQRTLEQINAGTFQTDTERMKMQAQGLSGAGGRPGTPSDAEQAADAIVRAAKYSSYAGFRSGA